MTTTTYQCIVYRSTTTGDQYLVTYDSDTIIGCTSLINDHAIAQTPTDAALMVAWWNTIELDDDFVNRFRRIRSYEVVEGIN